MPQLNWFPRKLAGQLQTLLFLALLFSFAAAAAVTVYIQRSNDLNSRDSYTAERVYELATTLEALDTNDRKPFASAARTRTTSVRIDSTPSVLFTPDNPRSQNLANVISIATSRDDVRASVLSGSDFDVEGDPREAGRNREVLAVSLPLNPDGWMNYNSREPKTWYTSSDQQFMLLIFSIALVSVMSGAWFFVRKLTGPIEKLADAARRAARGDRHVRIPLQGATEFRDASRAFNSMQSQIERFESERNRTIAAVGHDLRTPLTSLRVRAELIDDPEIRDPMIRTLEDVTLMANGLISYARSGQEEQHVECLNLHSIVETIANENGIPLSYDSQPVVRGGPVSLSRALRNLTDNAIRYAKLRSIKISTTGDWTTISVFDEGPGIPGELIESLFDPFVRVEKSRNEDTGGYGLGLSIAREIIQAHGGELLLNNHENGICAQIRLPLAKNDQ